MEKKPTELEVLGFSLKEELESALKKDIHGLLRKDMEEEIAGLTEDEKITMLQRLMSMKMEKTIEDHDKMDAEMDDLSQRILKRFKTK